MLKKLNKQLFSRSSVSLDILITGGSNIAVVLLTFLSYGLVARIYSAADLSEYMINRRLALTILPFIAICMPMALCRYLPLTKDNPIKKFNYTVITTAFILIGVLIISLALTIEHEWFSKLFYNKVISIPEISGLIMLCIGGVLIEHVSAYFRGMLLIKVSNLLIVICTGMMPLLIILTFYHIPVYQLLFSIGLTWTIVGLMFVAIVIRSLMQLNNWEKRIFRLDTVFKQDTIEILKYSLTRIPGIFCMALIWIVSPIMIVHLDKLDKSSFILAGLQFLTLATLPLRPIGYVFFPLFSEYKSQNKQKEISVLSSLVSSIALILGMYFTLHLIVLSPVILSLWLNISKTEAIIAVSIIILSMAPYMSFEINRNIIDTYFDRPYITYISAISLILMVLVPLILLKLQVPAIYSVAIGTVIAFAFLGYSTEIILHRMIIRQEHVNTIKRNYLLNFVFIFSSAGLLKLLHLLLSHQNTILMVCVLLLFEFTVFFFFIKFNIKIKTTWIEQLVEKLKLQSVF